MTIRIAGGSSVFGESLLFSENLKEIYRNPKKLKLQQFQKGSTDVAFGTCNPYFFHRFSPVLDLYTEKL